MPVSGYRQQHSTIFFIKFTLGVGVEWYLIVYRPKLNKSYLDLETREESD